MKKMFHWAAALLLLSPHTSPLSTAFAQGTAFTYQGRLNSNDASANGSYDLAFSLYAKENFTAVSPAEILAKVAALPISQWNYKTDPAVQKHLGPTAQDFWAAFGLNGEDDKHISVIDEGGVALTAVQGLNEKVDGLTQAEQIQIANLKTENADLRRQLDVLKQFVNQLNQKLNGGGQ